MIQSRPLKITFGLLALLCVGAYFVLQGLLSPPRTFSPPEQPSVEAAAGAEEALADIQETLTEEPAPDAPSREAFTKSLSEQALNDYLASHPEALPADLPVEVESVKVDLLPGSVRLMGIVSYHRRRAFLDAAGTFSFADGRRPRFVVSSLKVGRVPVTGPFRDRVCKEIEGRLSKLPLPDHVHVRSLEITDDSVIIYGDRYAR